MSASNAQILPLGRSIGYAGEVAAQNRAQRLGRCYPCSVVSVDGALITVKFELQSGPFNFPQVQMPLFGPEYIRYPIQPGDKGMAISADVYIGQMSGMGPDGTTADLSEQPNLSTLVFLPIGNKTWSSVNKDAVTIYGPDGVVLRDKASHCTITLKPNGVTISLGSNPLTITAQNITLDSSGNLTVKGDVIWGATPTHASTHHHSGVSVGIAQSGPPVPGT
jgi:hypothetical protein